MSRIALVTGGQRGIGLGIADALVTAGYKVALASRSRPDSPDVVAALQQLGSDAAYFTHDLQDIEGHASLFEKVERQFGQVSTLVSNAGVPARVRGDMLDIQPDNFDFVLGINLRGAFFLAQEAARRMLEMSGDAYRSITFVTSVSASMVSVERAEYCVSKAGAAMMAELFAVRLAPHGVGVFELRPGIIETGMTEGVKDKYTARIEGGLVPAQRWGQPEDIGSIVVPIADGRMAFATGSAINVDGGLAIPRL
ncbi:3-ketoacyl-ACP reductase [Hoeflea prorocentri]|uniref:3-ketoacyl-ACP reductase n=1 Tax=Hoeflea prorocentri TaxID=1922333 RepID=A0A9X3ZIW3_9HYPH|nr:3-ketoacyl-ACP reductase [Hoeflea prorocentri]MCY6382291.1 3-ketoacyl-ACP reductase [Hoeflea prorocentri]MDA5400091.1 3-ketoacyl-ACP reductase [Hoeflea prorocentri]